MTYPAWDHQLHEVMRRYPSAQIVDNAELSFCSKALYIPDHKLGSYYNKEKTQVLIPIKDYFPIMEPYSRYFDWKPFDVFTDKDVRLYYGGYPDKIGSLSMPIFGQKMMHWRGAMHTWNPYRDGLYNLLMIVRHALLRKRWNDVECA